MALHTLTHIPQPTDNTCGQTCIAMVADVPVLEVCKIIKDGYTDTEDLRRGLAHYGYTLGEMYPVGVVPLPPRALIFIKYICWHGGEEKHGHVAVWHYGTIYDPSYGIQPDYPNDIDIRYYAEVKRA